MAAARSASSRPSRSSVREDELLDVRETVRELITDDLAGDERELAGDLAAAFIKPNVVVDEELDAGGANQARANVPPVEVEVQAGEMIVREGQPHHRRRHREARGARADPPARPGRDRHRATR